MDAERKTLEEGLRSKDTFVLRRCQILLASSSGEQATRIAESVGCNDQTVREREARRVLRDLCPSRAGAR